MKAESVSCDWRSSFSPEVSCSSSKSRGDRPVAAAATAQGLAWDWQQQVMFSSPTLPVSVSESGQKSYQLLFPPVLFYWGAFDRQMHACFERKKRILTQYNLNPCCCDIPVTNQQLSHVAFDINNPMQDNQRGGENGRVWVKGKYEMSACYWVLGLILIFGAHTD